MNKQELVNCFSTAAVRRHDKGWVDKCIFLILHHSSLPHNYMVQVLKDWGLLCATTSQHDCAFIRRVRDVVKHEKLKQRRELKSKELHEADEYILELIAERDEKNGWS